MAVGGTIVAVGSGVLVGVAVGGTRVGLGVAVAEGRAVAVGPGTGVNVAVAVGGVVAVAVGCAVAVAVAVAVGAVVAVAVGAVVGVAVGAVVAVAVAGAAVSVAPAASASWVAGMFTFPTREIGVSVGVTVIVGDGVAVGSGVDVLDTAVAVDEIGPAICVRSPSFGPRSNKMAASATRTSNAAPAAASGAGFKPTPSPLVNRAQGERPSAMRSRTARLTVGLGGRWGRSRSPRARPFVCSANRRQVGQVAKCASNARLAAGSNGPSKRAEISAWASWWEITAMPPARPRRHARRLDPDTPPQRPCGLGRAAALRRSR